MDHGTLQKIFYGSLGLISLAIFGIGLAAQGAEGLAFGLFTMMILAGALICIWERSVVRSAFALMSTFIGIGGLFILLEADFLASAQILIYVGGILALLLFGVMLSPPDENERKLGRILPGLVIVCGGVAWVATEVGKTVRWAQAAETADADAGAASSAEEIGIGFLAMDQYVVAFELAAVVLTVALVAAVYIARRKPSDLEPVSAAAEQEAHS